MLNSDLCVEKIVSSSYYDKVLNPIELTVENTYTFGGYEWIVAEQPSSRYVVLQSKGVTSGNWPGYVMIGTLTNAVGNTINLTNAGSFYTDNIDGYDISDYDSAIRTLYSSIKAVEYASATYGKGLYIVSNSMIGTTTNGNQGSGNYFTALKSAVTNYNSFEAHDPGSWLGNFKGYNSSWYVVQDSMVYYDGSQYGLLVISPAFSLDTRLIKLNGNDIKVLIH